MSNSATPFPPVYLHAANFVCYFYIAPLLEIVVWHLLQSA